jgi:hypothetical protein
MLIYQNMAILFFSLCSNNNTSSNGKQGFLNNTTALYATSVGANGSTLRQIWKKIEVAAEVILLLLYIKKTLIYHKEVIVCS